MGDSAWLLRDLPDAPYRFVESLSRVPGVIEAVSSYETAAVFFDPDSPPSESEVLNALSAPSGKEPGRDHAVPVCYALGEDLTEVAATLGLTPDEVVIRHTLQPFRCHAVGFRPGFPYLGWLPVELEGIQRRPQPRVRVEAGSVAIADRQTGIYPETSPGGWAILGRTPLCLVDEAEDYFPIRAGDSVRFVSIGLDEFEARKGERL